METKNEWTRFIETLQGLEDNTDFTLANMAKSVAPDNGAYAFVQGEKDGYSVAGTFARNVKVPAAFAAAGLKRTLATLKEYDLEPETTPDPWHIGRAHAFMNVLVLLDEMGKGSGGRWKRLKIH